MLKSISSYASLELSLSCNQTTKKDKLTTEKLQNEVLVLGTIYSEYLTDSDLHHVPDHELLDTIEAPEKMFKFLKKQ